MTAGQDSWSSTGYLESGTISTGQVGCLNAAGTKYIIATAANRAATGRPAACIACSSADADSNDGSAFQAKHVGVVPPSISLLGAGTATYVNVSSAGYLARTNTLDSTVVGKCDADGTAYVSFPLASVGSGGGGGGFTPPTGTGFAHVTSGALDAASKKVDLTAAADVTTPGATGDIPAKLASGALGVVGYWKANGNAGRLRATYWDPVDGVTVRSVLEVSAGAVTGASEVLPTTGFIRISDSVGNAFPLIMRSRSGVDQIIINSSGGAVQFGDDSAVTTTDLRGYQVNVAAGAGTLYLSGGGIGIIADSQFNAYDARISALSGRDAGVLNTSGLQLGSTTIATSGGTTTLTSAQAASLCLVFTGTGGTTHAPDRTRNVYFADATGCSGAVTIDDGTATGVTVAAGKFDIIIHDGTNYRSALTNASGGGSPGGVSGQLQTNNGSGAFAGPGPYAGASYVSLISGTPTNNGVRLASAQALSARNNGGTADNKLVWTDASDNVYLGENSANQAATVIRAPSTISLAIGGSTQIGLTSTLASIQQSIALGVNPANSGILRIPNAQAIASRNGANSADVNICVLDGSNNLTVGATGAASILWSLSGVYLQMFPSSTGISTSVPKTTQTPVGATAHDTISDVAQVTTTNATATAIYTIALPSNAITGIDFRLLACQNNTATADIWRGRGAYKNAAGTGADVQAAVIEHGGASAWTVTMTRSTTTVTITVTGAASTTIVWGLDISYTVQRQS